MIAQLTLRGWDPNGTADHLIKWIRCSSFEAAKKYAASRSWDVVDIDDYPTVHDENGINNCGVDAEVDDNGEPIWEVQS